MTKNYQKIEIWRIDSTENAIRVYNIFRNLGNGHHHVISMDYVREKDIESRVRNMENLISLFIDMDLNERIKGYDDVEEAIAAFDKEFS